MTILPEWENGQLTHIKYNEEHKRYNVVIYTEGKGNIIY